MVTANRRRLKARFGEVLFGGIHDVDVLGKEHDLADAVREVHGVVGRESRFGLTNAANHRKDVVLRG